MYKIFCFGDGAKALGRWIVFAIILIAFLMPTFASNAVASADTPSVATFYLAIGASDSVGVQPTAAAPNGERTNDGYANDIVDDEGSLGLALDLQQIGCPGETTTTMLYGGDACYRSPDSQLNEAVAFLQAHQSEPGLVTIDLGFNNVKACLSRLASFEYCVNQQTEIIHTQLSSIVKALQAAAGPEVDFVGLNHDDPYLADSIRGGDGPRIAIASLSMIYRLNQTLQDVYSSFKIPVADVASAFSLGASHSANLHKISDSTPQSSAVCTLTWMCVPAPFGPNVHPDDAGYRVIAKAIEAVLPPLS